MTKDASFPIQIAPDFVDQDINPWSFWLSPMRQLGMINVIEMKSSDPRMERTVTENVAGYGRQLGRITEALYVLLEHTNTARFTDEEKEALNDFTTLAEDIAVAKACGSAMTRDNVERFLKGLRELEKHDPPRYREIAGRLKDQIKVGAPGQRQAVRSDRRVKKASRSRNAKKASAETAGDQAEQGR
jgi:hypothetical protein